MPFSFEAVSSTLAAAPLAELATVLNARARKDRESAPSSLIMPSEEEFLRFYFFLCKDHLISQTGKSKIDTLYQENEEMGVAISNDFYKTYKRIRNNLYVSLKENNPDKDELLLFTKSQKIMDRFIFICFCEDCGLLPSKIFQRLIDSAKNSFSFSPTKLWDELRGLFRAIDLGSPPMQINRYNGGLFKTDPDLDSLVILDDAAFVETMEKDLANAKEYLRSHDYSSSNYSVVYGDTKKYGKGRSVRTMSEMDLINSALMRRAEIIETLSGNLTKEERTQLESLQYEIDNYLTEKLTELNSDVESSGVSYISNPTTEDEKAVNEWLSFIDDFNDKMMIAMGTTGAKENAVNRLILGDYAEATKDLQALGEQGAVTADHLADPKYDDFMLH